MNLGKTRIRHHSAELHPADARLLQRIANAPQKPGTLRAAAAEVNQHAAAAVFTHQSADFLFRASAENHPGRGIEHKIIHPVLLAARKNSGASPAHCDTAPRVEQAGAQARHAEPFRLPPSRFPPVRHPRKAQKRSTTAAKLRQTPEHPGHTRPPTTGHCKAATTPSQQPRTHGTRRRAPLPHARTSRPNMISAPPAPAAPFFLPPSGKTRRSPFENARGRTRRNLPPPFRASAVPVHAAPSRPRLPLMPPPVPRTALLCRTHKKRPSAKTTFFENTSAFRSRGGTLSWLRQDP